MAINIGFCIMSALILGWFVSSSVVRFGFLRSFSSYEKKWEEIFSSKFVNVWGAVMLLCGCLLAVGMLPLATLTPLHYLGFLSPLYLIVISFTPDWGTSKAQYIIRTFFTILCFFGGLVWLTAAMKAYFLTVLVFMFSASFALFTRTGQTSFIFWLEVFMYLTIYLVVIIPLMI